MLIDRSHDTFFLFWFIWKGVASLWPTCASFWSFPITWPRATAGMTSTPMWLAAFSGWWPSAGLWEWPRFSASSLPCCHGGALMRWRMSRWSRRPRTFCLWRPWSTLVWMTSAAILSMFLCRWARYCGCGWHPPWHCLYSCAGELITVNMDDIHHEQATPPPSPYHPTPCHFCHSPYGNFNILCISGTLSNTGMSWHQTEPIFIQDGT